MSLLGTTPRDRVRVLYAGGYPCCCGGDGSSLGSSADEFPTFGSSGGGSFHCALCEAGTTPGQIQVNLRGFANSNPVSCPTLDCPDLNANYILQPDPNLTVQRGGCWWSGEFEGVCANPIPAYEVIEVGFFVGQGARIVVHVGGGSTGLHFEKLVAGSDPFSCCLAELAVHLQLNPPVIICDLTAVTCTISAINCQ